MSLAKAIQFGSLVTQSTPAEKESFVRDLAASDGQMIIDALSSYFLYGLRSEDQIMRNDRCILDVSTIIHIRTSQVEEPNLSKVDTLPPCIIGACAM